MKTHPGGRLFLSAAALGVAAVFATALVVVTIWAGFSPTHHVELSDNFCGVNADITTSFSAPGTDYNYAKFFAFTPVEFFPDEPVPIGAKAGRIAATLTLGLLNGPCAASLSPSFDLYWATTDTSSTVTFSEQFPDCPPPVGWGTLCGGVTLYPDFLVRMFPGLTPVERQFGAASISGQKVSMNIVVFEAGDLPGFPAVWGRPSVTVLNDIGDPAAEPPTPMEAISDVCSPFSIEHTKFGLSQDNPATGDNEAGFEVRRNPPYGGTYIFRWYAESMRDADGDGIENCLDTCPFDVNVDSSPKLDTPPPPDNDGIDSSCDPDPAVSCWPGAPGMFNDCDGDFFYNRGDNCPLVSNQDQLDADTDCIGDACDLPGAGGIGKGPSTPDGEPIVVTPQDDVEIVGCPPDCRAGVDTDGDHFFNNNVECYVGTDPLDACPDGPTDDAWPPDIQAAQGCGFHDGRVDILDVLCYKPKLTGPYDNRYDLDTNGAVEILDVLLYKPVMKTFCTNP